MVNIGNLFNDLMNLIGLKYYNKEESDEKYSVANHSHNEYVELGNLNKYIELVYDGTTGELVLEFSDGKTLTYMSPNNLDNIVLYDDEDNVLSNKNIRKIDVNGNETTIKTDSNGVINYSSFRSLFFDGDDDYKKCRYDRRILRINLDLTLESPPENTYHSGDYDFYEDLPNLNFRITGTDNRMPIPVTYSEFTDGKFEFPPLDLGEYTVSVTNADTIIDDEWFELDLDSSQVSTTVSLTEQNTNIVNAYIYLSYKPVNFIEEELIDIPVQIVWEDENNAHDTRPNNVTVRLFANGVEVDSRLLNESNSWSEIFTERPLYDEEGDEITYSIDIGSNITMYHPSIEGDVNGYEITLTLQAPTETFYVTKIWDDNQNAEMVRPKSIVMTLKDENELSVGTVTLNAENSWSSSLTVQIYTLNYDRSDYTWTEQEVSNYTQTSVTTQEENTTFVNTYQERPVTPGGGKPPK